MQESSRRLPRKLIVITPFHRRALTRVHVLRKQLRKALRRAYELSLSRPGSMQFRAALFRVRYLSIKHQAARKLAILLNRRRPLPVRVAVPPPQRRLSRPSPPRKNRRFANVVCMPAVLPPPPPPSAAHRPSASPVPD